MRRQSGDGGRFSKRKEWNPKGWFLEPSNLSQRSLSIYLLLYSTKLRRYCSKDIAQLPKQSVTKSFENSSVEESGADENSS
jgi:hypothetical protein